MLKIYNVVITATNDRNEVIESHVNCFSTSDYLEMDFNR